MSKLGDLIRRLAAQKGLVVDNAAGDTGDGSSSGGAGGAPSPSIYGSKSYWEDRYETGILGHSSERGVMSNEWWDTRPSIFAGVGGKPGAGAVADASRSAKPPPTVFHEGALVRPA